MNMKNICDVMKKVEKEKGFKASEKFSELLQQNGIDVDELFAQANYISDVLKTVGLDFQKFNLCIDTIIEQLED